MAGPKAKKASRVDPIRAIADRLNRLRQRPDGVIEHRTGKIGQVVVAKQNNQLFLVFCPGDVPLSNDMLSGVMARIDLADPWTLKGIYTQAMLACLAFTPRPRNIYVMGAGGGRLATVLHRLLGNSRIFGSEIDPDVLEVSRQFFGLENGPRMRITCAEGRSHLSGQPDGRFDHIYLDCFDARGSVPRSLSTAEFFSTCARKLAPRGVACVNLVDSNPDFGAQMDAFLSVFPDVREFEFEGTHVLFGTMSGGVTPAILRENARDIQTRHAVGFSLQTHVESLRRVPGPTVRMLRPLLDNPF